MEAIVLDEGGRSVKRQEIFGYFQAHKDYHERAEFLEKAYHDTFVEILTQDGTRVGYHKEIDGLRMWKGSFLSRSSESVFSWGVISEMAENLMERGEYKIQLSSMPDAISEEGQLSLFNMKAEENTADFSREKAFAPKEIPQEVVDKALYTAGNDRGSIYRTITRFRFCNAKENAKWLSHEYGTDWGRGIIHDGAKYAVWYGADGMTVAQGNSVMDANNMRELSWDECSARTAELLREGCFASQSELDSAQDVALRECANALILTARDLNAEARALGLFAKTLEIYEEHRGFPECADRLAAFMCADKGVREIRSEFEAFKTAYEENREIMRFRFSAYNAHRIDTVFDGIDGEAQAFTAHEGFERSSQLYITNDEIDKELCSEGMDTCLAIYSRFCTSSAPKDRQAAIKRCYGEYSGSGSSGYNTLRSSKGLKLERSTHMGIYDTVSLSIPKVTQRYAELITAGRFPGKDAIEHIPEYQAEIVARKVYFAFTNAPKDVPRPYPADTNFYDAFPAVQEQLRDTARSKEILSKLTALIDSTAPDDRSYEERIESRKVLEEYINGSYDLFGGRHRTPRIQEKKEIPEIVPESVTEVEQTVQPESDVVESVTEHEAPKKPAHVSAASTSPLDKNAENYRITDDTLGAGTPSQRYANNVSAIQTLKNIELKKRVATADEQEALAKYVGWGGLADCFDPKHSKYEELKSLLSDSEYAAARESTLTAFYTPPVVIRSIYEAIGSMGFDSGNICDPACGTGNFIGMLPDKMQNAQYYGVELDSISGRIARQLYPKAAVAVQGFEKTDFSDSFFDVMVGNVPFGQFKVPDKRYDKHNFSIHDYFFARSLDKVRPGGVIAFVTSSYTMDKKNPSVRKYIAQRAELLGAIRLPNNTFKSAASTEVTSDILFLQKRDRMVDSQPDWVHLGLADDGMSINQYFLDHPEMVMGEMRQVSGPFGPEAACIAREGEELGQALSKAVLNIHAQITDYAHTDDETGADKSIAADPNVRNFSFSLVDGEIYFRENSRMNHVEVSKTAEGRIRGLIGLRDCVRTLIEYQTEDFSDEDIEAQQAELNTLYDDFTAKYGLISSRGNAMAFDKDSSYFLLSSLEVVDNEGKLERKADLFSKRTIRAHKPVDSVDTAAEALAVSIGEKARVDIEYMSALSGKSEDEIISDLSGVIFRDIGSTNPADVPLAFFDVRRCPFVTADEYLSGNVRKKLEVAEFLQKSLPAEQAALLKSNVESLRTVQPTELTASEINVRLGATWLNPEYVRQFTFELLGTPSYLHSLINVRYSEHTGEWNIEGKTRDRSNVKAFNTYGSQRASAYHIIEETLNLKDVRVFDYVEDAEGRRVPQLNKKETAIAQSKQELIKAKFSEWLWNDPERREDVCKTYNELFNSNRPREYDGSHITFGGINTDVQLREHQINAIARVLYGGNTLLAHVVGAGKSATRS